MSSGRFFISSIFAIYLSLLTFPKLQINYLDWDSEAIQSRKCYEVATKHGKPVIVMAVSYTHLTLPTNSLV